jgi:RHS repeat-associated protein
MQFTGHERDVHLTTHSSDDLYYMHARYYNPTVGRFLSTDPLRGSATSPQSFNLYGYVRSNPINFIDPWGLAAEVVSCDGGGYCGSITVTAGDSVSEIAGRIRLEWLLARMRRERERLENERRNLRYIQANDFYLIRIAEQGKRPCSKSFSERFLNGFSATNGLPGLVAPAGAGLFTTKTIAKGLGLPTLRQFARGGLRGLTVGGEALGGVEAGAAAGSASVASFAYVGAAWEVGVTAGSAIAVSWDGVPCDF